MRGSLSVLECQLLHVGFWHDSDLSQFSRMSAAGESRHRSAAVAKPFPALASIAMLIQVSTLKFNSHFWRQCVSTPLKVLFNLASHLERRVNKPIDHVTLPRRRGYQGNSETMCEAVHTATTTASSSVTPFG